MIHKYYDSTCTHEGRIQLSDFYKANIPNIFFHLSLPFPQKRSHAISLVSEVGKSSWAYPFPLLFLRSPSYRDGAFGPSAEAWACQSRFHHIRQELWFPSQTSAWMVTTPDSGLTCRNLLDKALKPYPPNSFLSNNSHILISQLVPHMGWTWEYSILDPSYLHDAPKDRCQTWKKSGYF